MTTCTRYPCGGTRHGCPMDDCPGRQDATPLADTTLLTRVQSFVDRKYVARSDERQKSMGLAYVEAERQDLAREIVNFIKAERLRAAPQTPDAVREALDRIVISFQAQADRYSKNCDDPKFNECQKEIWASLTNEKLDDLRVLRKALSSASAGPQSEAVAIFPALDAAQEALNLGAAIRYLRETPLSKFDPKHLIVLIALVQSRLEAAHPQPQQADGRGAVSSRAQERE